MYRAGYARLKVSGWLRASPDQPLKRASSRTFATGSRNLAPRPYTAESLQLWGKGVEHRASLHSESTQAQGEPRERAAPTEHETSHVAPASNRFSSRATRAPQSAPQRTINFHEDGLQAEEEEEAWGRRSLSNIEAGASRTKFQRPPFNKQARTHHGSRSSPKLSRVNASSTEPSLSISPAKPWNQVRTSPDALRLAKVKRGNALQWGYMRHQYPEAELLGVKQAFNSWKSKLANVEDPEKADPGAWGEDGKFLLEHGSIADMRQAWEALDGESRREIWPLVMLSALHLAPGKANMVLEATFNPLPPGYAIHDVLLFIARNIQLQGFKTVRERTLKSEEVLELLTRVVEDTPSGHVPFGQRTFGILARKLPADQTSELYSMLLRSNHKLHPNTLLHFASTLAGDAFHKKTAFEILEGLAEGGADLNEAKLSSIITSLLHCKASHDGWSQQKTDFSAKDALESFIEKGFMPNVVTTTAFLDSLCQHSEVAEAIRLSLLFAESGVKLDSKAWATVFRGAKHSLKIEHVVKALDVAKASSTPYVDVLNNALHTIFYFAEMESREKRLPRPWTLPLFGPMLRIYAKKFDLEALQWWLPDSLPLILAQESGLGGEKFESVPPRRWDVQGSIIPVVDEFFSGGDGPQLRPSSTTIALMLRSYIKSLQQPFDLMTFYAFFKARLEEQDSRNHVAAQLIRDQGSLIHDTIIMAMTERKGLSRPALQIFGDMLKEYMRTIAPESSKAQLDDGSSRQVSAVHPSPSVCTFSILVHNLQSQGESILANQVIQVMREQGIEPNLVTWNTLTKGYALTQNVSRTVATLRDMEAAGLKPDLFTFKAFGKLKNQDKALEMMESIIDTNRKTIAEEEVYE